MHSVATYFRAGFRDDTVYSVLVNGGSNVFDKTYRCIIPIYKENPCRVSAGINYYAKTVLINLVIASKTMLRESLGISENPFEP